jgi:hypothetical protein
MTPLGSNCHYRHMRAPSGIQVADSESLSSVD